MKTTSETTSEIEKFYAVRKRWIAENADWKDEPNAFFMDLYMQTYPARKFPLTMELLEQYEGNNGEPENADGVD